MKKIFKYLFGIIVVGSLATGCETTELDIRDNPNALTTDQADVNLFINSIQISYAELQESFGFTASQPVRLLVMQNRNYLNAFSPEGFNGRWSTVYAGIFQDIAAMKTLAEANEQYRHIGVAQILQADLLTLLVDFFGDVPFSDANRATEGVFNPALDTGAEAYQAALDLLDEAINNLNRASAPGPSLDFFYDGDWDKWEKLANTLKMKIYLQRRLVDGGAVAAFNTIVSSGNYIQSSADDFQFQYGANEVQPDTRHPEYADNYIPQGAGTYMSHYLMNLMGAGSEDKDPRMRYYFYRQTDETPGQDGVAPNEETLSCSLETAPQHYLDGNFPFCGLPEGYWGRDHGDDDGIPPDGLLRTAWGVYPVAGMFDDDRFERIGQGKGGGGTGIVPIVLASWVDIWKAEIALVGNNPTQAQSALEAGIEKSIRKVITFGPKDPGADSDFFSTNDDAIDYAEFVGENFANASSSDKWNILAEQLWVATFGNGRDAFNFYRRTGFPNNLQPNREPNPGGFVRLFRYPSIFTNNNTNVQQRQNVTSQTFWDNNPSSPGFPVAN
ncbi:MAG: SusD/RagB family nutrient-binding outer membrane lipoprotein [Bacteroidetes bacterium]|nr:SusD/RagB family nutrient-binding outer membrane lipoprotein [Bacteroidota bacterium]